MTKTAWAHLPNARHIAAVLADVRARPEAWWGMGGVSLGSLAWGFVLDRLSQKELEEVYYTSVEDSPVHGALIDIVAALIAWDSSADLLDCTPDVLRAMIDLAEPPVCHQAALLLPYAIVRFGQ